MSGCDQRLETSTGKLQKATTEYRARIKRPEIREEYHNGPDCTVKTRNGVVGALPQIQFRISPFLTECGVQKVRAGACKTVCPRGAHRGAPPCDAALSVPGRKLEAPHNHDYLHLAGMGCFFPLSSWILPCYLSRSSSLSPLALDINTARCLLQPRK